MTIQHSRPSRNRNDTDVEVATQFHCTYIGSSTALLRRYIQEPSLASKELLGLHCETAFWGLEKIIFELSSADPTLLQNGQSPRICCTWSCSLISLVNKLWLIMALAEGYATEKIETKQAPTDDGTSRKANRSKHCLSSDKSQSYMDSR